MKRLSLIPLILLAVAPLQAQPTNGAVYWSTTQPDCSSIPGPTSAGEAPVAIMNTAGTTVGYSCYVSGTFSWFAAGGIPTSQTNPSWGTSIRVAAPASAPIGVDYTFFDVNGNSLSMDTTLNNVASSKATGNEVDFALSADQPAEVEVLGATANAPAYATTSTGSVYGVFYCPDANTCLNVLPQLLYSSLPTYPWSISVPIAFDFLLSSQWSAVGVNDNVSTVMSLVIYNEDVVATTYRVSVFNSAGSLVGTGTTPTVQPGQNVNGVLGEGATYGAYLSQIVPNLPAGVLKVVVDGGANLSAVVALQFTGPSATSLQVAFDTTPGSTGTATFRSGQQPRVQRVPASRVMFRPLAY